jgi:RES domain-containing protein
MLSAWRNCKARYATRAFDGEGARVYGGRWNSPGTRVAYASESVALATLEVLVGLQDTSLLTSYSLIKVEFARDLVETVDRRRLPISWSHHPPTPETQRIGDLWIAEVRSAVLEVPSAVVEAEHNFLFNPTHEQFSRILVHRPKPFRLDPRLVR